MKPTVNFPEVNRPICQPIGMLEAFAYTYHSGAEQVTKQVGLCPVNCTKSMTSDTDGPKSGQTPGGSEAQCGAPAGSTEKNT